MSHFKNVINFGRLIFVLLLLYCTALSSADKIPGYIIDAKTGTPVNNVNIMIRDTEFGATSDEQGYFELNVTGFKDNHDIIFSHVGYEKLVISIGKCKRLETILMIPADIKFDKIQIEGKAKSEYTQTINNEITILSEQEFNSGGYLDAADLIVTKNSVMIDETLSGRKTISVRGANPEETLILYDGIKINSSFNNIFDLSLLNPATLSQVDIIKGGNLATFDGIGSAAVINFIPKLEQDYLLRFHQRFGSYNSGDWGANFYKKLWNFKIFGSIAEGASSLYYAGTDTIEETIDRTNSNITINTKYDFNLLGTKNYLKGNYIKSGRNYYNEAYRDTIEKKQDLITVKYGGNFYDKGELTLAYSTNLETEDHQFGLTGFQNVENDNTLYQFEYILPIKSAEVFAGFKRDEIRSELDEFFSFINNKTTELTRASNDLSAGFRVHNEERNPLFDVKSIGVNYSFKMIRDEGDSSFAINDQFEHNKSSYMVSSVFGGETEYFYFNTHVNYSSDFRLPTPYQMLLSQHYQSDIDTDRPMLLESKRNTEIGVEVHGKSTRFNWLFSGIFFSNRYSNKYREIQLSRSPVVFLDNYKDAEISGIEGRLQAGAFENRIQLGVNYNHNLIDDKSAFPFKLTSKFSGDLSLNRKYLSTRIVWFNESQRTGIIYYPNEGLKEIQLDEFANLDVHVRGNIDIWRTNLFCAFSARNLLGGELIKEGIAIRDRRFYLTVGIEVK